MARYSGIDFVTVKIINRQNQLLRIIIFSQVSNSCNLSPIADKNFGRNFDDVLSFFIKFLTLVI